VRPTTKIKPMPPELRIVLDKLCQMPAKVYDFTEVAEATGLRRGVVERTIKALRHPRWGGHLATHGPSGLILRPRYAYLPADAAARASYPPLEHPTASLEDHPTLLALRVAADEAEMKALEQEERAAEEAAIRSAHRAAEKAARAEARAAVVAADEMPPPKPTKPAPKTAPKKTEEK
jgi:hypothetical protein